MPVLWCLWLLCLIYSLNNFVYFPLLFFFRFNTFILIGSKHKPDHVRRGGGAEVNWNFRPGLARDPRGVLTLRTHAGRLTVQNRLVSDQPPPTSPLLESKEVKHSTCGQSPPMQNADRMYSPPPWVPASTWTQYLKYLSVLHGKSVKNKQTNKQKKNRICQSPVLPTWNSVCLSLFCSRIFFSKYNFEGTVNRKWR